MASAKSALYVNPVGRYEQPRVTKLCAVQQPMQDSVRAKLAEKNKFGKLGNPHVKDNLLHLILLQKNRKINVCISLCVCVLCMYNTCVFVCKCLFESFCSFSPNSFGVFDFKAVMLVCFLSCSSPW